MRAVISATRACTSSIGKRPAAGHRNSLYFTDKGHAGGLVFDFGKPEVRDFLIQNAKFFLDEYRVDGFRYDQVSVIDHDGAPHGWRFCQDLTSTLRAHRPGAFDKAEYWNVNPYIVKSPPEGAGFDTSLTDGLRIAIRRVIGEASAPGRTAARHDRPRAQPVAGRIRMNTGSSSRAPKTTTSSIVGREERVARLGDPGQSALVVRPQPRARRDGDQPDGARAFRCSSWDRSFSKTSSGRTTSSSTRTCCCTGPGSTHGDKQMLDHLRFTRELIQLRWRYPGLRGQGFRVVHAHDANRVLAFHRWIEGTGDDVIVVVHLAPFNRFDYRIGFPDGGEWREVFNSDVYEQWVNPNVAGNGGRVFADGTPLHGFAHSAALTLPANSVLVFAR